MRNNHRQSRGLYRFAKKEFDYSLLIGDGMTESVLIVASLKMIHTTMVGIFLMMTCARNS